MSYAIANIIYGVPLSQKAASAIQGCELVTEAMAAMLKEAKIEMESPEAYGFEPLYSAGGCMIGYCGVKLGEFDETDDDIPASVLIQKLSKKPTLKQSMTVQKLLARAHPEILKLCKPCGVYVIWSSS